MTDKHKEELAKALEGFNQTPLNLTDEADDGAEDPQTEAKIQQEYQKFMNEMKNLTLDQGGQGLQGLTESLGGLLKGLTQSLGVQGVPLPSSSNKAKT